MILYCKINDTWQAIPALIGPSPYDIAVKNGFSGTEAEWLTSLKGEPGSIDNLTKANVEAVFTGNNIISHGHDTLYQKLVDGKGLSTKDFTETLFTKLTNLSNYDDTAAIARIVALETWKTALTGTSADSIINTFKEIEDFLAGITGTDSLTKIMSDMRAEIVALIPTNNNSLTNGAGYQTSANVSSLIATALADYLKKTDISDWAKASTKPSYSYSEISGTPADRSGVNTVTTLASLPVDKDIIYATLSAATDLSLASALTAGQSLTIVCMPSADITQPLPITGGFTSMDGDSISLTSGKLAEISILCYATGLYSISSKIAS